MRRVASERLPDGRLHFKIVDERWTMHKRNDDGDSDGGSGTTDGHDHWEEEDDD